MVSSLSDRGEPSDEHHKALLDLRDRLAKASGPDRKLDDDLAITLLGWRTFMLGGAGRVWKRPDDEIEAVSPHFTASRDAAVMMLLPVSLFSNRETKVYSGTRVTVILPNAVQIGVPVFGVAKTEPLALCLARVEYELQIVTVGDPRGDSEQNLQGDGK